MVEAAMVLLCLLWLGGDPPDVEADPPYLTTVRRYLQAKHTGDVAAQREILAEDSRIWFGEKRGPGQRRDPGGRGPWADWDELFRSESEIVDFRVEGSSLRTTVREINDWYRLVERPPALYYITYEFDGAGRIAGMRIHSIPDAPPRSDRLDEFRAWAERRRPGLLDELMPGGEIDPALDKARRFKRALLDWREEAGIDNPLDH